MRSYGSWRRAIGVTVSAVTTCLAAQAFAQEIAVFDAGMSRANAVSANGDVVVGWSGTQTHYTAVQFTAPNNVTDLIDPNLLFPNQFYSEALGVSDSGAVIVGQATFADGTVEAFRRTASGTDSLGLLNGGAWSKAYAVSGDGAVIVGAAVDGAAGGTHATIWSGNSGPSDLGFLSGGHNAEAYGISGDGTTVVGYSDDTSYLPHAVTWSATGGQIADLGLLPGGFESYAYDASDDGGVVVGWGNTSAAHGAARAFRWTQAGGLEDLGSLDGSAFSASKAYTVSGNGQVVVGTATANSPTGSRAFRYTDADGMITVEDWLRNAGATIAADITDAAYGTNCDGSVVVGQTVDKTAFIARAQSEDACLTAANDGGIGNDGGDTGDGGDGGGTDPGLITLADLDGSLGDAGASVAATMEALGVSLNGAGSRPLDRQASGPGRSLVWVSGDLARDDHGARDGNLALGEIGFGHDFGAVQLNAAAGLTGASQDTAYGGRSEAKGTYAKFEALAPIVRAGGGTLWGLVTGVGMLGSADITRNYMVNGGQVGSSAGSANVSSLGARARLEWENALPGISPYGELAHTRTCVDAYAESGGAFPASFDRTCASATEARFGLDAKLPVAEGISLIGTLEGVHRFEKTGSAMSGQVIGLGAFSLGAPVYQQNWLRAGAGFEADVAGSTLSFMANATSKGEAPRYWLAASWRKPL